MTAPAGARLAAFRQFVVKVHSRCNLACDHCYVYEHADQSWRSRPVVMSDATLDATAHRIAEHCRAHDLDRVRVVLHGGEPLLAGPTRIRYLLRQLRSTVPETCDLDVGVQTNGLLLDDEWCELLLAERIQVGISLDGDLEANDRHRRYEDGRSSHAEVVAAVRRINRDPYRDVFAGLLCTIDLDNDPIRAYRALRQLDPPRVDFLLPHATWDQPPPRPAGAPSPYADWLLAVHAAWLADGGAPPAIKLFESITRLLAGEASLTEMLGLDAADVVVVETDGAIELADSLKTAYDGAPSTGLSVHHDPFDDALGHPGVVARAAGTGPLCATCRACRVVDVCGGGLYAHRYRSGHGFENPSVYCDDLLALISGVHDRTVRSSGEAAHTMAAEDFDDLAAGGGGPTAIAALAQAQQSLRRARVAASVHRWLDAGAEPVVRAAWETLTQLDERAPRAVDTVLAHPYVRTWAGEERSADGDTLAGAYLGGMALAVSVIAGLPARVRVPAIGELPLPTLGALRISGAADRDGTVEVAVDPSGPGLVVAGQRHELAGASEVWRPLRRLDAGGVRIALDDLDPYRDRYHRPVSPRLADDDVERWQHALDGAWAHIEQAHPEQAAGLAGLTAITPLEPPPQPGRASATEREAQGAIAVALPPAGPDQALDLAVLVLHEVQHLKLGSVLDLFELVDRSDGRRFEVGWRPDPRPLEAVLQGAYAHLVVVEFWRALARRGSGRDAERAATTFAALRGQTRAAIDQLVASGSLTVLGRRWVERMRITSLTW